MTAAPRSCTIDPNVSMAIARELENSRREYGARDDVSDSETLSSCSSSYPSDEEDCAEYSEEDDGSESEEEGSMSEQDDTDDKGDSASFNGTEISNTNLEEVAAESGLGQGQTEEVMDEENSSAGSMSSVTLCSKDDFVTDESSVCQTDHRKKASVSVEENRVVEASEGSGATRPMTSALQRLALSTDSSSHSHHSAVRPVHSCEKSFVGPPQSCSSFRTLSSPEPSTYVSPRSRRDKQVLSVRHVLSEDKTSFTGSPQNGSCLSRLDQLETSFVSVHSPRSKRNFRSLSGQPTPTSPHNSSFLGKLNTSENSSFVSIQSSRGKRIISPHTDGSSSFFKKSGKLNHTSFPSSPDLNTSFDKTFVVSDQSETLVKKGASKPFMYHESFLEKSSPAPPGNDTSQNHKVNETFTHRESFTIKPSKLSMQNSCLSENMDTQQCFADETSGPFNGAARRQFSPSIRQTCQGSSPKKGLESSEVVGQSPRHSGHARGLASSPTAERTNQRTENSGATFKSPQGIKVRRVAPKAVPKDKLTTMGAKKSLFAAGSFPPQQHIKSDCGVQGKLDITSAKSRIREKTVPNSRTPESVQDDEIQKAPAKTNRNGSHSKTPDLARSAPCFSPKHCGVVSNGDKILPSLVPAASSNKCPTPSVNTEPTGMPKKMSLDVSFSSGSVDEPSALDSYSFVMHSPVQQSRSHKCFSSEKVSDVKAACHGLQRSDVQLDSGQTSVGAADVSITDSIQNLALHPPRPVETGKSVGVNTIMAQRQDGNDVCADRDVSFLFGSSCTSSPAFSDLNPVNSNQEHRKVTRATRYSQVTSPDRGFAFSESRIRGKSLFQYGFDPQKWLSTNCPVTPSCRQLKRKASWSQTSDYFTDTSSPRAARFGLHDQTRDDLLSLNQTFAAAPAASGGSTSADQNRVETGRESDNKCSSCQQPLASPKAMSVINECSGRESQNAFEFKSPISELHLIRKPIKINRNICFSVIKQRYKPPQFSLTQEEVRELCSADAWEDTKSPSGPQHFRSGGDEENDGLRPPSNGTRLCRWIEEAKQQLVAAPIQHYSCPPKMPEKYPDIQRISSQVGVEVPTTYVCSKSPALVHGSTNMKDAAVQASLSPSVLPHVTYSGRENQNPCPVTRSPVSSTFINDKNFFENQRHISNNGTTFSSVPNDTCSGHIPSRPESLGNQCRTSSVQAKVTVNQRSPNKVKLHCNKNEQSPRLLNTFSKNSFSARALEAWRDIQADRSDLDVDNSLPLSERHSMTQNFGCSHFAGSDCALGSSGNVAVAENANGMSIDEADENSMSLAYSPKCGIRRSESVISPQRHFGDHSSHRKGASSPQKNSSKFTFSVPNNPKALQTSVMFPLAYIEEFSPSNPRRRDSDAVSVEHQRESLSSLSIQQHLKAFRPRRHMTHRTRSAPSAVEENCDPWGEPPSALTDCRQDSFSKRRKISRPPFTSIEKVNSSFISSSSSAPGYQDSRPVSLSSNWEDGLHHNSAAAGTIMAHGRASTPVRDTKGTPLFPLDETVSTIFSPPESDTGCDAPSVGEVSLEETTEVTVTPGTDSDSEVDLI
ncbi:uncharacterized protein LOC101848959 [Aplysia californica]|uniref:Uncharacterized protein LOC101848959 n=1 Tax=Aplysia californica TaxID=6500 RepID=A0ABM0JKF2_APLCA|nr:uncharacterized protein LOC101848959 [Aplysia californica]